MPPLLFFFLRQGTVYGRLLIVVTPAPLTLEEPDTRLGVA